MFRALLIVVSTVYVCKRKARRKGQTNWIPIGHSFRLFLIPWLPPKVFSVSTELFNVYFPFVFGYFSPKP